MASAMHAVFAALLLAGAACVEARYASNTSVDISLNANATVENIADALLEIQSERAAMREEVNRVTEGIMELMGEAYERGAALDQELRYHIVDECWYAQALATADTWEARTLLVQELQHLLGDMEVAAQQVADDETLSGALLAIRANISAALEAVRHVQHLTDDLALLLLAQGHAAVSTQVDIMVQKCNELIDQGHEITLQNQTDVEGLDRSVADFLNEAARNAIAAGKHGIQLTKTITKNSEYALAEFHLEIQVRIATDLITTQNQTDIVQTAAELQNKTQSFLKLLLTQVKSELENVGDYIRSYKKGLEIQVEVGKYLLDIFNAGDKLNLTETVNEILTKKEIALQNVTSIIASILQIVNDTEKLNHTDIQIFLYAIQTEIQTIQLWIQKQDIKQIVKVISQLQNNIKLILQNIRNSTAESEQELCIKIEKVLDDILDTLDGIQQLIYYAENKIQTFVEIFCKNTTLLVQNANELINNIINHLENVIEEINNSESINIALKYEITSFTQNAIRQSSMAQKTMATITKSLENLITNVREKILQIVIVSNKRNETDELSYIEKHIHVILNKFVYEIRAIISSTLEIQNIIEQQIRNQLNIISLFLKTASENAFGSLNTKVLLDQIVQMQFIAIKKTELVIAPIQDAMEYILTLNYTDATEIVDNILGQTQALIEATENLKYNKVVKIIQELRTTIRNLIDITGTFTEVPENYIDQVQSIFTNLTTVELIINNTEMMVTTEVRTRVVTATGSLQLHFQLLLTYALDFIEEVQTLLTKVTDSLVDQLGTTMDQMFRTILQLAHQVVERLQDRFDEISSIDVIVTKLVAIMLSYNQIVSGKAYLAISNEISLIILECISAFQKEISGGMDVMFNLRQTTKNQINIINFFKNTGTEDAYI